MMTDINANFLGGYLAGQSRSPVTEDELKELGYRPVLPTQPKGDELVTCFAVPIGWTSAQAHQSIKEKVGADSRRKSGKRSI